jgi:hypothetical protein
MTEGREETIEGGVVLRFPGDWVGPLEELVPFGPAADREPSPAEPDFWGEDSAVLQGVVEALEEPRQPERQPLRLGPLLLPAGAVLAAVLFAVAAVLGGSPSRAPHVRAVTFAIGSLPRLAPTTAQDVMKRPKHHAATARPRSHPNSTRPAPVSTHTTAVSSPVSTPSSTYHPPAASSISTGSSSSPTGGAFTLGGP